VRRVSDEAISLLAALQGIDYYIDVTPSAHNDVEIREF